MTKGIARQQMQVILKIHTELQPPCSLFDPEVFSFTMQVEKENIRNYNQTLRAAKKEIMSFTDTHKTLRTTLLMELLAVRQLLCGG